MGPRAFLDVADELAAGPTEGHWRSAVSRAYYAAFHTACVLLRQCGFSVPQEDQAHVYLWMRLSNGGHPDVSQAGRNLRHLRNRRNQADYDLALPLDQRQAVDLVQVAADILDLLEQVSATPVVRDAARDAIRVYERDVLRQVTWRP
jgi:uncharacterized protein (UPF0332 family)